MQPQQDIFGAAPAAPRFDQDALGFLIAFARRTTGPFSAEHVTLAAIEQGIAGGSHLPDNLRTACKSCNCARRHSTIEDFRLLRTLEQAGLAHILSTTQAKALMQAGIDLKLPSAHVFFFERHKS